MRLGINIRHGSVSYIYGLGQLEEVVQYLY